MTKVTALVLNFEYEAETKALVEALSGENLRTVVIDNSKNPDLEAWTDSRDVEYLATSGNVGYGEGNNRGMERFQDETEYFLILNPDIETTDGFVEELTECMDRHENVGILSPELTIADGGILQTRSKVWAILRKLSILPELPPPADYVEYADFAQGAVMMVRTDVFESIGGFYPSFFLYGEEIEYSIRARQAGFDVAVCTAVSMGHTNPTQTVEKNDAYKVYYDNRNRFLLGDLRFSGFDRLVYTLLTFGALFFEALRYLEVGDVGMIRPLVMGVWDGLRGRFGKLRYLAED